MRIFRAVRRIEADEREQFADLRDDLLAALRDAECADRLGDDVERAPARVETGVRVLEDHLNAATERAPLGRLLRVVHRNSVDDDVARGRRDQPDHQLAISAVTEGELRYRTARWPDAARLQTIVDEFLIRMTILPWDSEAAQHYGQIRAALERQGQPMGDLDMMSQNRTPATIGAQLYST